MLQKIKKEKWWCLFCCWCWNNKSQVSLSFSFIFTLCCDGLTIFPECFSACSMSCWDRLQHPHDPIGKNLIANSTLAFHTNVHICLWNAFSLNQRDILNFNTLLIYDYQSNSLHIHGTETFIPILYTDVYLPGRLIDFYLAIFKLTSADNHANFEWLTEMFFPPLSVPK